jgi:hypothetical protein
VSLRSVAEKATRLHEQDRVLEIASVRVFAILDDTGNTRTVVLHSDGTASCSCGAKVCHHIGAAILASEEPARAT